MSAQAMPWDMQWYESPPARALVNDHGRRKRGATASAARADLNDLPARQCAYQLLHQAVQHQPVLVRLGSEA